MRKNSRRWMVPMCGLALGVAAIAPLEAQTPVTKQRPVVNRDTLNLVRVQVDTVFVDKIVVRVDTVWVRDTVRVVEMGGDLADLRDRENFYFGLGAGAAVPSSGLDDVYSTGFNVTGTLGWRSESPLGVRLTGSYNQFDGRSFAGGISADAASSWGAAGDLTLDLPFNRNGRSALYLLGGGGVYGFSGWDIDDEDFDELLNDGVVDEPEAIRGNSTNFGVNAGVGLRFPVGNSSLFLEGRYVNVFADNQDVRFFPITLGINF